MTIEAWALFCLTEIFLCLNPGPSAMVVISLGMTRGRRAGVMASVGVIAANAIYFALSATGLAALLNLSSQAFEVVRWCGAGYLVFIGGRTLIRSFRPRAEQPTSMAEISLRRSFWQGLVAQGANPGLIVYFTAILPQFIDAAAPLSSQVAVLAFSSFIIEFSVLSFYSTLSSRAGSRAAPKFRNTIERLGGGFLIAAGARLAAIDRE